MAWLDDRAWCHPKLVALSDRAHRAYINAISYSSGMGLRGVLGPNHQKLVGSTPAIRRELVDARLWDDLGAEIGIHDWESHNEKRDERKARDRERKRAARSAERPQDSPQDSPQEHLQDGSALTVSDRVTEEPNGSSRGEQRARNPIWDALAEVFGEPSTDSARTLRGKICSSLTRAGATPEEIISRAKSWPRHFEHATLTETALEKHWAALGRRPLRLEQR